MNRRLSPVTIVECGPGMLSVSGEIDMSTAGQLDELQEMHGPLRLDLDGVTFMDASGVAALVRLYQRCPHRDCTLLIDRCSAQVERVLRIVNLYSMLTVDGTGRSMNSERHGPLLQPLAP